MEDTVIVRRSGALGDIILMDPFFRKLGERFKKIWFLTAPRNVRALQGHPNLDKILTRTPQGRNFELVGSFLLEFGDIMGHFIDMDNTYEKHLDMPFCKGYLAHLNLQTDDIKVNIYLTEEEKVRNLPEGKWVVVDTGYKDGRQFYSSTFWNGLFDFFRQKDLKVVCIGTHKTEGEPDLDLSDKNQELRKMFSTINSADYFVGIDSAPIHIAKALKKPGVGIYCAYKLNTEPGDTVIPYFCDCYTTEKIVCGMKCKKTEPKLETIINLFNNVFSSAK